MLLSNSQEMYRLCWRKCPLCPCATAKKFTVGDGEWLVRVIFYTLLGCLTVVSTAPQLLCFPQWELAAILRFRAKSKGLGKSAQ